MTHKIAFTILISNLSCLQASSEGYPYIRAEHKQVAPLHWCHDERPHSEAALYTEWNSAQPPIQS